MTSAIAAGRAYVELLLKDESFNAGLKRATERWKSWGEGLKKTGTTLKGWGNNLLAPFISAVPRFTSAGARLDDLSQRISAPLDDLQRLNFAFEETGTSLEENMSNLIRFQKELAKSGKSGKDFAGSLMAVADELHAIDDPARRMELLLDKFGKGGATMMPLFAGGSAQMRELFNRADALGIVAKPEDIAAAAKLDDTYTELKLTTQAFGNVLASSVIPYLQPMVELAVKAVSATTKWVDQNRELAVGLAATGAALFAIGSVLIAMGGIATAVGAGIGGITTLLALIASPAAPVVAIIALVVALGVALITLTGQWENLGKMTAAWAKQTLGNLELVLGMLQSNQWQAAAGVMALSIIKGLEPLAKWGTFGIGGTIGSFLDLGVDARLKEVREALEKAKQLDAAKIKERENKPAPDLADALAKAGSIVRPTLGFMNSGSARLFGAETAIGLQRRQVRELEMIREEIRALRPRLGIRLK